MSENLLSAYSATPSFAIWDGEHAILSFTGNIEPDFVKVDSKGKEQHYLGIEVMLISHSTVCILRTGKESTLAKWANDEQGGIKSVNKKTIFKAFNSAKLGFDLRIES